MRPRSDPTAAGFPFWGLIYQFFRCFLGLKARSGVFWPDLAGTWLASALVRGLGPRRGHDALPVSRRVVASEAERERSVGQAHRTRPRSDPGQRGDAGPPAAGALRLSAELVCSSSGISCKLRSSGQTRNSERRRGASAPAPGQRGNPASSSADDRYPTKRATSRPAASTTTIVG